MTISLGRRGVTLMELVVVMAVLVALAAVVVPLVSNTLSNSQQSTTLATMTALRTAIIAYHQDMKGVAVAPSTTLGTTSGTPSYPGTTGVPTTLMDLQFAPKDTSGNPIPFNPYTQRGWRGPYLMQATGMVTTSLDASFRPTGFPYQYPYGNPNNSPPDTAFVDGWGNPIVLQWPQTSDPVTTQAQYVRLVSAGPPSQNQASTIDTLATTLMPRRPTTTQPSLPNERGNDLVMFIFVQDQYPAP